MVIANVALEPYLYLKQAQNKVFEWLLSNERELMVASGHLNRLMAAGYWLLERNATISENGCWPQDFASSQQP